MDKMVPFDYYKIRDQEIVKKLFEVIFILNTGDKKNIKAHIKESLFGYIKPYLKDQRLVWYNTRNPVQKLRDGARSIANFFTSNPNPVQNSMNNIPSIQQNNVNI
jgi:hypothetical protein